MRHTDRRRHRRPALATTAAAVAVAMAAVLLPACTPPAPAPPEPTDIALMSDALLQEKLLELKPVIEASAATAEFQAEVPAGARAAVDSLVQGFATPTSRAALGNRLRTETATLQRGLAAREEVLPSADVAAGAGGTRMIGFAPTPPGQRDLEPLAPSGQSVPIAATSGPCRAPQGVGTVPAPPSGTTGGTLLLPQHDVHTVAGAGVSVISPGRLSVTGQEPVAGQGPGVEFRNVGATGQQMKVRIHLQDPKGFGPRALYPLISIRPLGGSATDEVRPTVVDGGVYCYAGDTSTNRGYFEGWISFPRTQPGFQVIAEVVENDYWFAVLDPALIKDSLATPGPQYFAGADRSTIHVGDPSVTSAAAIPRSIGAFASATADPGDGTENILTDTDGQPNDDLEQPIAVQVKRTLTEKVNDVLSGDLSNFSVDDILAAIPKLDIQSTDALSVLRIQARPLSPVEVTTDLSFVDPSTDLPNGFAPSGETPGAYRALRADLDVGVSAGLNVQLLGVACNNFLSARVDATVNAWAWADSSGPSPEARLRALTLSRADVDLTLSSLGWLNPICILARLVGPLFYSKVSSGIDKGIAAGIAVDPDQCAFQEGQPSPFDDLGRRPLNVDCVFRGTQFPKDGTLAQLLNGFDLNAYLPSAGGVQPVVTNIDNAWCRATGAPVGCTPDQSLIGKGGLEVTADAALLNSLGDAVGAPLGGRFRNVYAPPRTASVEDVVTSHRDARGQAAGLGIVVDPRQVNLALRHLAQGTSTTRTTNGLLDLQGVQVGPLVVGARPEVPPALLGIPPSEPVLCGDPAGCPSGSIPTRELTQAVVPDLRLDVTTAPGTPPITFSVAASTRFGVGWNGSTSRLDPTISSPLVDLQLVSGCQADYVKAYAASYFLCGRGGGGAGLPTFGLSSTSLTDIANFVVNRAIEPALDKAVGEIRLPDLTGLLPGLDVAVTNVRSAQRGNHLAVYADLKPAVRAGIAISPTQPSEPPGLRFFPSNVSNLPTGADTTWTWEVRDDLTGQPVTTTVIPNTGDSVVRAPLEAFSLGTDAFGQVRRARAKLTVSDENNSFTAVAEGTYSWRPPTPPPPTQCVNGSSARLVSGGGTTTQVGGLVCQVP